MFYFLSKVFWIVAAPSNLVFLALFAASCLLLFGRWKVARVLVLLATAYIVLAGFLPMHAYVSRPLEDRFKLPVLAGKELTGIIVLGGVISQEVMKARGVEQFGGSASRMTVAARLALQFPKAKVVFSGGRGFLGARGAAEARGAKQIFGAFSISSDRVILESRSRNTFENIRFTRDLVKPKPGENWVLVTSAFHMPRTVGIARKAGFTIIPYPVDYGTLGRNADFRTINLFYLRNMRRTDMAIREWIGLITYYLGGKTSALLPGPL